MRTGLILLRSCIGFGRGSSCLHKQCGFVSSAHHLRSITNDVHASPLPISPLHIVRPLSSSPSSSFEAPEPPISHGQAVFPNIDFSNIEDGVAIKRNADPEAVFVVTGSNRGIGLQFVITLLERTKGKVVACCRSPTTSSELNKISSLHPDRIEILPLNLEEQETIDELASTIATQYKRVDALFNVAGILGDGKTTPGPERSIAYIEREWMEKTLAVNVVGPTMLAKALSPLMRTTGRRSVKMNDVQNNTLDITLPTDRPPSVIVNLSARVGSISDNRLGGWYSYRIAKAALNQATRTMGLELKRQGTWIVALHPGTTNTDLSKPFQKNVKDGRLFPVEFTVGKLLDVVVSMTDENTGGFYDWAGKALPF